MINLKNTIASLPAVLVALLPQLFCPACWPAYTSILSSLGIGFINYSPLLFPLTALFLLIAIGGIFYKAETRRGYSPFFLAIVASAIILIGKFALEISMALYAGIGLLLIASVWNALPKKEAVCSV
ncbi:MAG: hypothetical protein GQ569_05495 [Methylococcaceae bacterium]|nr:hypothetical protein [Methylococcaceae bacterium]